MEPCSGEKLIATATKPVDTISDTVDKLAQAISDIEVFLVGIYERLYGEFKTSDGGTPAPFGSVDEFLRGSLVKASACNNLAAVIISRL